MEMNHHIKLSPHENLDERSTFGNIILNSDCEDDNNYNKKDD